MPNVMGFPELEALKTELRNLAPELTTESLHIAEGEANASAVEIRAAYGAHRRTGNLQDHVAVVERPGRTPHSVRVVVQSTAKHAWLFENGSQARHNALGANRGSMPATPTFVPIVVRRRRAMYEQLKDLLVRHGLLVSGDF